MKPIEKKLTNHFNQSLQPISLHVPGHHYGTIGHLQLDIRHDVTEITGMDDLHHPESIIKESQEILSRNKNYSSRYLVGGTTAGIVSVISAFANYYSDKNNDENNKKENKKNKNDRNEIENKMKHKYPLFAIARNAHKSVFNGLNMNRHDAYILPTSVSERSYMYSGIVLDDIDEALLEHVKLAVVTYPNYFGEVYDIEEMIKFFHRFGIAVLVDEAHGAHFDISGQFPKSSLNYGADIVVQSYHKTLPALTMSSVIHVRDDLNDGLKRAILKYLSVIQSSSPSYLLMEGLEKAHQFYLNYEDTVFFKRRAGLLACMNQFDVSECDDPLKLLVRHPAMSGVRLQRLFEENGIYTELANDDFVLFVLPLWHEGDSYLFDELCSRIIGMKISEEYRVKKYEMNLPVNDGMFYSDYYMIYESSEVKTLDEVEGLIAAEAVIPYPPGIPYILPGEVIRREHIDQLKQWLSSGGNVHGIDNHQIRVRSI